MTKLLKVEKKNGELVLHYMGRAKAFKETFDIAFEAELVTMSARCAATFNAKGREPGMIADDEIYERAEHRAEIEARAYNLCDREKAVIQTAFIEKLDLWRDYIISAISE